MRTWTITRRVLLVAAPSIIAAVGLSSCASPFPTDQAEAAYPPIGAFVRAEGLAVHYWTAAPEDPALAARRPAVLIHGASGNLRDWTWEPAKTIAETRPVVVFDRPGFGFTARQAEAGWDPAVQARLLREATEKLGYEQPIVVGHSWGAAVAMAWAIDAPDEISGVVPVSGVTIPYKSGTAQVFEFIGLDRVGVWIYTKMITSSFANGGVERFLARAFRPQRTPEGYADYVGAPLAVRAETLDANSEDIRNLNTALVRMHEQYSDIEVPVEILHGQADFIPAGHHARGLAEAIPSARLTIIPGVGHMAHHAATDVLIDALDTIDPPPGSGS